MRTMIEMSPQATVTLAIIFAINIVENLALHPLSDEFIAHINALNTTWKAGRNFHPDTPLSDIKILLGALKGNNYRLPKRIALMDTSDLPENFDPREKWPYCPSLNEIRDQGRCGSCWAFGAVEMMTDRYCIYSKGKKQFHFSAEDLMTCVSNGCNGGLPYIALNYWKNSGIVSGGNYGSGEGCRPYTIEHCDHTGDDKSNPCKPYNEAADCDRTCQSNYSVAYYDDLKFGKDIISIEGEDNIMAELYNNGPVEASFGVYDDFPSYKSGVYQRVSNSEFLGGHAIKMLGWGVEGGVKYWLCANSWSPNFGDQGFFKILRGTNHCGIESGVIAGEPIVD